MLLIFCSSPLDPRKPDMDYVEEIEAAKACAIDYALISYEALIADDTAERALWRVPQSADEVTAIYRGWMMKPGVYRRLYTGLLEHGVRLINDPIQYRHCHYFPEAYPLIAGDTPQSVWLPLDSTSFSLENVMESLTPFGDAPIIVKDYVKSQKHYWHEAFYIPSAADQNALEKVVRRFLELQGDDLNEGLVFRAFEAFEPLGHHVTSGMPITREYRLFLLDQVPLYTAEYWGDADYGTTPPHLEKFLEIAKTIQSRFFTMDIAQRTDGTWRIVELGDGQVAGLPERGNVNDFYHALKSRLSP